MTNRTTRPTSVNPTDTTFSVTYRGSSSSSDSGSPRFAAFSGTNILASRDINGNTSFARGERCILSGTHGSREVEPQPLSDSSAIDLCDSDDSDVEIVRLDDGPDSPLLLRARPIDSVASDARFSSNFVFGFPFEGELTQHRFMPGFDFIEHIQERIRTQAMLLERLRVFSVDIRPPVPPSIIIQSLPVRRVKDMADASALGACPICLEPYKPRMTVRVLPSCGHAVHKPCMDKWICKGYKYTCPLDNRPIDTTDLERPIVSVASPNDERPQPLRRSSRMSRRLTRRDS